MIEEEKEGRTEGGQKGGNRMWGRNEVMDRRRSDDLVNMN